MKINNWFEIDESEYMWEKLKGYEIKACNDGIVEWTMSGKYHKEDGPSIIGEKMDQWWVNDVLHREDGPAISSPGVEEWWFKGVRHRKDGPALTMTDGINTLHEYWIHGVKVTEEE